MIAFACAHCGMKLTVKPELAGRTGKCPACKRSLTVPLPEKTVVNIPTGQVGTASSVAQIGVDAGVTLAPEDTARRGGQKPVQELLARRTTKGARYLLEGEIARGGMGAVLRAVDCDLRREVAIKYLLDQSDPKKKLRFVEEAQITSQLEHPNVVPIHELGLDAQKRLFLTMKMVKGRSLAQVLDDLRQIPRAAEKDWPLGRLLNVVVNVCHALAYAHNRGVIHRDLKPANIMVGDFGEVYVMDWGLAKVLATPERDRPERGGIPTVADIPGSPERASKVVTDRSADADLTQDGAVLGTPVYMPPEQATGRIQDIDQRSDVYALGAILYELLTLLPPIDKEGGYLSVLMRVTEGEIVPPEQRAPQRARAGKMPKELTAVAMKALSKEREQRYPTVEELRRDIERFQEGRTVSAKEDTRREMIVKFIKRNPGFSAGMAAAVLVLMGSLYFIGQAWLGERRARAENEQAQAARREQARKSVPAFVRAAQLMVSEKQFDDALTQVELALSIDDGNADGHLLRAQLLIGAQRYEEARKELAAYLKLQPGEKKGRKLEELCRDARPNDRGKLLALADELGREKLFTLADRVTQQADKLQGSREELLASYRRRIDAAWTGLGNKLTIGDQGVILDLNNQAERVKDLTPLQGMKLTTLWITDCKQVRDLTPLKGMPLTELDISRCPVQDLSPLQGMRLTRLIAPGCQVRDLSPLTGLPLNELNFSTCGEVQDLAPLKGMPLTRLNLYHCRSVRNLSPLDGMKLTDLNIEGTGVQELSVLKKMPLTKLWIGSLPVEDLSLLKGMKLTELSVASCHNVRDLALLKGMPLTFLAIGGTGVVDLKPLKGMPLAWISLRDTNVEDLTPLQGMPLQSLYIEECERIHDLTPLEELRLKDVHLKPKNIKQGMNALRRMKSIENINTMPVADFWKKYDAGEFK
jgi:serine/threonine protein kinase